MSFCHKSSLISEHSMSSESQGAECLGLIQQPVYKHLRPWLRHCNGVAVNGSGVTNSGSGCRSSTWCGVGPSWCDRAAVSASLFRWWPAAKDGVIDKGHETGRDDDTGAHVRKLLDRGKMWEKTYSATSVMASIMDLSLIHM
jgi:hypothetical protein